MGDAVNDLPSSFGYVLSDTWFLSSDNKERDDDEGDTEVDMSEKSVPDIFAMNHDNLLTVVMDLMTNKRLKVAVSKVLLDPGEKYINTGRFKYEDGEPVYVSPVHLTCVGSIEKVMIPALQILYRFFQVHAVRAEMEASASGSDYTVRVGINGEGVRMRVVYKFNGHDIMLTITNDELVLHLDD